MEQPSRADRYGSLMVDVINILLLALLLMYSPSHLIKFTAVFIPVVYFPILHTLLSRSIGDMVFKLKVVDNQGNRIGFRLALKRFFYVLKSSIFAALFTNLLFMLLMLFSGTIKDISEVSFDYEGESGTYLIKAS
ncbi:MAG TPA: RDD family protein [Desulfobacteria bacterium]|nr:RDD family protein [Desulfobacteria bacterium]